MIKYLLFLVVALFALPHFFSVSAQDNMQQINLTKQEYFKAKVVKVISQGEKEIAGYKNFQQVLGLTIQDGYEKGKDIKLEYGGVVDITPNQRLSEGENVVIAKTKDPSGKEGYFIVDRYRLDNISYILVFFFLLVFIIAGKKGIGSVLGMLFGLFVILKFIVPLIIQGYDPLLVSITGSLMILIVAIYIAHGISRQTTSAVISTFLSLTLTGVLAFIFVKMTHLTGLGNEDSYSLQFGNTPINLEGLLLGGIIIGTLGILDDITTSQAAVVYELYKTDKKLSISELFKRGFRVGREHVASLVNTLILVYAGVSLALFILFVLNPSKQPVWVLLNYEMISEEVIRTIAGSIGLTLAVPISTFVSAYTAIKYSSKKK